MQIFDPNQQLEPGYEYIAYGALVVDAQQVRWDPAHAHHKRFADPAEFVEFLATQFPYVIYWSLDEYEADNPAEDPDVVAVRDLQAALDRFCNRPGQDAATAIFAALDYLAYDQPDDAEDEDAQVYLVVDGEDSIRVEVY